MALIQERVLLIYELIQCLAQIIKLYLQNKGRKTQISQNKGADGFKLTLINKSEGFESDLLRIRSDDVFGLLQNKPCLWIKMIYCICLRAAEGTSFFLPKKRTLIKMFLWRKKRSLVLSYQPSTKLLSEAFTAPTPLWHFPWRQDHGHLHHKEAG